MAEGAVAAATDHSTTPSASQFGGRAWPGVVLALGAVLLVAGAVGLARARPVPSPPGRAPQVSA